MNWYKQAQINLGDGFSNEYPLTPEQIREKFVNDASDELRDFMRNRGMKWSSSIKNFVLTRVIPIILKGEDPETIDSEDFQLRLNMIWSLKTLADKNVQQIMQWPEEKKFRMFKLISEGKIRNPIAFKGVLDRWYPE